MSLANMVPILSLAVVMGFGGGAVSRSVIVVVITAVD